MPVSCSFDAGVAVITLDVARGGAIDPAFVADLHAVLDEIDCAGARAIVITGTGRVFLGALDVVAVHAYDRADMGRFMDGLDDLFRRVFASPRPTVAAVNGHAVAGGCVLALACDLRIMADGRFHFGANEVQFGVPFPATGIEILRHAVPAIAASAVLLQGKRFSPAEAERAGLVHRLAGERGVVAEALDEARVFASASPAAVQAVKGDLVEPVLARIDATRVARRERFLDHWFSPEVQARIGALRDEHASRGKPAS